MKFPRPDRYVRWVWRRRRRANVYVRRTGDERAPKPGEIVALITETCPKCGWEVAIPGEGQIWPPCPTCGGDPLIPRRLPDGPLPSDDAWANNQARAYIAIAGLERELFPIDAANRRRVRSLRFWLRAWRATRPPRAPSRRELIRRMEAAGWSVE